MMYLSMSIHNIAVMIFTTAYMVIHVHPIWAVCILFTHRNEEDSNESGRDKF